MTKAVRIENADSGLTHRLIVQVWDKGRDLGDGTAEVDTLVSETLLGCPTAMIEVHLCDSRYLIVKGEGLA